MRPLSLQNDELNAMQKKSFGTEKTTRGNYDKNITYCDKDGLLMMNFGINIFFGISYSTIVMHKRTI